MLNATTVRAEELGQRLSGVFLRAFGGSEQRIAAPMVPTTSCETTRFDALRHGVLSRHTVSPWEDRSEYEALLDALAVFGSATAQNSSRIVRCARSTFPFKFGERGRTGRKRMASSVRPR
jgi:hypothetical protein